MLNGKLIHPQLLSGLASSGHGSKILIADGNFPFQTHTNPAAHQIFLNLSPGLVGCVDVLRAICSTIVVENSLVMAPAEFGEYAVPTPEIWSEFEQVLSESGNPAELQKVGRFPFYDFCRQDDLAIVVATGEQKIYANLLLTIGVVR